MLVCPLLELPCPMQSCFLASSRLAVYAGCAILQELVTVDCLAVLEATVLMLVCHSLYHTACMATATALIYMANCKAGKQSMHVHVLSCVTHTGNMHQLSRILVSYPLYNIHSSA